MKRYLILLICTVSTLSAGCQMAAILPDGQHSAMGIASNVQRATLDIEPRTHLGELVYSQVSNCVYKQSIRLHGSSTTEDFTITVSLKPIEDKYLVVLDSSNRKTSTALITYYGKLLDFNIIDSVSGERYTSESYGEKIQQRKKELGTAYKPGNTYFVNPISIFLPELENKKSYRVDQVVSTILEEEGSKWGEYVYRGVSDFEGQRVLVLDLIRTKGGGGYGRPLIFGYNLLDVNTKVPILTVLDGGTKSVMTRIVCNG